MKRILSVILSIMLIVGLVPMMAFAETTEDTTDIKTSLGLDYSVYDADPGDATPATLTVADLMAMTKEVGVAGNKRNYTDTPPYIRVNLGKKCEITSILTFSGGSVHRSNSKARYSLDGDTWYDLPSTRVQYNRTAGENTYNATATYASNLVVTEEVVAKYLEITFVGNTSDKSIQMNHVNIYGTPLSATRLSTLTAGNAILSPEFDPAVTEYTAEISTYEDIPTVSATAETEGATVTITQATQETMKATVEVAYEGEATKTYTINFSFPVLDAPLNMSYANGILKWAHPSNNPSFAYKDNNYEITWTEPDGTPVRITGVELKVYNSNDELVKTILVNQADTSAYRTPTACYLKAYIDQPGTYKVTAAYKKATDEIGEIAVLENVVIDDATVVSLPENGATAKSKAETWTEETDATTSLLSKELRRGSYFNKETEGYFVVELAAPAKVSSFMVLQQSYPLRGTYYYSLTGEDDDWTALEKNTDFTVSATSSAALISALSSSGYNFIDMKDDREFVAKYIKYVHDSQPGNYGVNQLYINGEFVDVDYTDLALTESEGKVTASVKGQYVLDSTPSTDGSAVLFTATYKVVDGMKVLVSISDRTTIKGYSLAEAVAKSVEVNAPTEAGTYVVKAFLFNNMSTIVPLVASPEITITVQ